MSALEIFKHSLFVTLFVVLASEHFVHAQDDDQAGFISLDCGLTKSSGNYTEPSTGIKYISDEPFVNGGVSKILPLEYRDGWQKQVESLRAFPDGIRNCYTINVTRGTSYIIRAGFYYGNYDNRSYLPSFDIHVGANFWDSIIFYIDLPISREIIYLPLQDYVRVCLVNNGTGVPIISSLELRPLMNETYRAQSGSLVLDTRTDLGTVTNRSVSYPSDTLDRDWHYRDSYNYKPNWTTISTALDVNPGLYYKPPSEIMRTAITPTNPKDALVYSWSDYDITNIQYVYLHFAEIEKLKANESRSFNILVDGKFFYGPIVPRYLNVTTIQFSTSPSPSDKFISSYNFTLVRQKNSTLPPILNAIEIYTLLDLSQSETNQDDVEAISMIKSTYKLKKNWDGDPCAPLKYVWTGLSCSYEGSDPPRITALNLSSSGLNGEINSYISKITMLQSLDLSNNGLTGSVPEFLSEMQFLTVLKLENNNFTGSIPATLLEKSKNGSLELSFSTDSPSPAQNDINQCGSSECKRKKKNILVPVVASAGGLVLLLLAAGAILIGVRRKKKRSVAGVTMRPAVHNGLFEAKNRQFTYSEVVNITNDFEVVLGRGGFGTVYHGIIGDTQVAVKKLSASSGQGYQQFQAEVKLLVTVHHRNLTSLVGYCFEGTNMALIYEYMANGDLHSHLFDESNTNVLPWERRLQIAVESAQGLEYLHSGCKPPIVHRDVKATNILLTENFQAKLADFGLSKSFSVDGDSHVSTVVAGTPGYLDPEYSSTNWLTEKSDVYSFGVVLLEIITGRSAILSRGGERTHISQWVSSMLSNGDIKSIVDQRLKGNFEASSAWKAVEIAMACVCPSSNTRPNMGQVVTELKECLAAELAGKTLTQSPDLTNQTDLRSPVNVKFEYGPLLR